MLCVSWVSVVVLFGYGADSGVLRCSQRVLLANERPRALINGHLIATES